VNLSSLELIIASHSPKYTFGRPQKAGALSGDRKILAGMDISTFPIDRDSLKKIFNSIDFRPKRAEGVFLDVAVCGRCMTFCMIDFLCKLLNQR